MPGGSGGRFASGGVWLDAIRRLLAFAGLYLVLTLPLQFWGQRQEGPASRGGLFVGAALTLAAALVAGMVMLRGHGRRAGALGFAWTRSAPAEVGRGLAVGVATTAVAVALMLVSGAVRYVAEPGTTGFARVLFQDTGLLAVAAAAEEALFRGYPFQLVTQAFGPTAAILMTSAGFALAHAANPHVTGLALANIFLAGVLLGLAYYRTRSLWFATALHLGWNWTLAVLADLPTSGLEMDTPLYRPVVSGPAWLTGGGFGPEGGLVVTFAVLLAIAIVARWGRLGESPGMRALRPLVDGADNGERQVHE